MILFLSSQLTYTNIMNSMNIQSLRGFRDFYPEDQFKINYLRNKIAEVCNLFGYEEFEGPALEPFELYAAKSSDEIVTEQAFVFEDRGGEKIALRPELTPTLARMIAAKQGSMVFPARLWSFGRFWRYERPQKGRGREFYQWNCDILGNDSVQAEVEILEIIIRFLSNLGLTRDDIVIELNDRQFINDQLAALGLSENTFSKVFKYLDKRDKLDPNERAEYAKSLEIDHQTIETMITQSTNTMSDRMKEIISRLKAQELDSWIQPNVAIVRGFTYYTGIVFEVSDREKKYRALLGGGRYGNLVEQLGGKPLSGIGFGMGDMVLLNYLQEKGLLPAYAPPANICIIAINDEALAFTQTIAETFRQTGLAVLTYEAKGNVGKGLKFADTKQCRFAVVIGQNEVTEQKLTVKNLETGKQDLVSPEQALTLIKK